MNRMMAAGIVTVIAGLVLAATAWNFSAVASMPEIYITKQEATQQHQNINRKLDKILDVLIGIHTDE